MTETPVAKSDDYLTFFEGRLGNPYPFYHRLRSEDPVHWSERFGCWILTRYADVSLALRDQRFSANRICVFMDQLPSAMKPTLDPLRQHLSTWLSNSDPPNHTRLRSLVNKAFTPKMVEGMSGSVQGIVDSLVEGFRGKGEIDMIHDFAYPLPATVISDMLGVPPEDRDQFKKWAEDVMAFTGGGALTLSRIANQAQNSLFEMYDYFKALIRDRRCHPKEDLISALSHVDEQGETLSEEELLGLCDQLLTAGHDTTRNLIGNGVLALLQNRDQLEKLKDDFSLIPSAVEELLRFDSPLQRQTRVPNEDLELGGRVISKGQPVFAMLGAANRDPAQFFDPDKLDICRRNNGHLAFGSGIHYCLGAPLSRLEGQIALRTILQRLPSIRISDSPLEWRENVSVRGLKSLRCFL